MNNLSAACIDCNQSKGDMTAREFMAALETVSARRNGTGFWDALAVVGGLAFLWWLFFGRSSQRQ